jgi:hypothetical protein
LSKLMEHILSEMSQIQKDTHHTNPLIEAPRAVIHRGRK